MNNSERYLWPLKWFVYKCKTFEQHCFACGHKSKFSGNSQKQKLVRKSKQRDRGKINIANSADFQIERVKALQNCSFSSYINTDWGKIEAMCRMQKTRGAANPDSDLFKETTRSFKLSRSQINSTFNHFLKFEWGGQIEVVGLYMPLRNFNNFHDFNKIRQKMLFCRSAPTTRKRVYP